MVRKNSKFLAALLGAAAALSICGGQVSGQTVTGSVDRAQLAQTQGQPGYSASSGSEGIEDGHAASSPNDADIGEQEILKRVPEYQPFTLSAACPIFYTSNVALTRSGEMSDVVFAPVVGAAYDPRITRTLYGHFAAREQVFYYGDNSAFNFGSLDVEAGLNYFLPQFHNLILRGWYDFNRLTLDDRLGDEFFSNHAVILNAEVPFRIDRAQQISVGADANLSVAADHQSPRRNDYEAYAAYSVSLTRAFSVNAGGRVVLRDYHQNGRTDVSEILALSATYRLTNWCAISAISSFAHSDSNHDAFDYDVANVGGVLGLSMKF